MLCSIKRKTPEREREIHCFITAITHQSEDENNWPCISRVFLSMNKYCRWSFSKLALVLFMSSVDSIVSENCRVSWCIVFLLYCTLINKRKRIVYIFTLCEMVYIIIKTYICIRPYPTLFIDFHDKTYIGINPYCTLVALRLTPIGRMLCFPISHSDKHHLSKPFGGLKPSANHLHIVLFNKLMVRDSVYYHTICEVDVYRYQPKSHSLQWLSL